MATIDNRLRLPAPLIDFANDVGLTGQEHDNIFTPGIARFDHARMAILALLANQSSFSIPIEFRVGTIWYDLNVNAFKYRSDEGPIVTVEGETFVSLANGIEVAPGLSLQQWFEQVSDFLSEPPAPLTSIFHRFTTAIASETMGAGTLVYVSSNSHVGIADDGDPTKVGVIGASTLSIAATGQTVIQHLGLINLRMEPGLTLAAGDPVFLASNGRGTNTISSLAIVVPIGEVFDVSNYVPADTDPVAAVILSLTAVSDAAVTALAGAGLFEAGSTINVGANADGSIVVNADNIQVGVLATDAQHGVRGGGTQHAVATTSVAGFMSAADKTKLDASGILTSSTPVQIDAGDTATVGAATTTARADHQHALNTAVVGDLAAADAGAAAAGTSMTIPRGDHKHTISTGTPVSVDKSANSAGAATTLARSDHKHDVSTAAPIATSTANAEGVATTIARSDHVHRTIVTVQDEGTTTSSRPIVNFIGAAVTVTDNGGSDRADVTINPSAGLTSSITENTTDTTTTSATDVLVASMTTTPAAGTYLVWFTGTVENSNAGGIAFMSIYSGGVQVAASEREIDAPGSSESSDFTSMARTTVNGSQAIEGQWRVTLGTETMHERQLVLLRVA